MREYDGRHRFGWAFNSRDVQAYDHERLMSYWPYEGKHRAPKVIEPMEVVI